MKILQRKVAATRIPGVVCAALYLFPINSLAQPEATSIAMALPIEMSMASFLLFGALLLFVIIMFFVFQTRFRVAHRELKDITNELGHARERLTDTSHELEKTNLDLKNTTNHYQGILFDAEVGMFQMDLSGKCTYINNVLQELSDLYPKKALKEGLDCTIHPDDRERFKEAWAAFIESDEPFELRYRFKHTKGREVHVVCNANKVLDEKKEVESYIGWVSDVTHFHEEQLRQEAATARYANFIEETIEGYYQLVPEVPIPITDSTEKMTAEIMSKMTLTACNDTFAAMYGTTPSKLTGKTMNTLQGGCGPFKNADAVKNFIKLEYKAIGLESVRQDPRGNCLNLLNNVVGLIEDNKLVGIWGSQTNISQHKREQAELTSQAHFMRRILNALPADIHVKDTRCRYLYASKKLSDRTGIPQEGWIGKTIFEVMPATARDHDKMSIDVMKTGKLVRTERPYEARGKSGWLETVQTPLISDEGLVEGVVGLSFEISERKKKEEEVRHYRQQLEQQLKHRSDELQNSQKEHGATSIALRDTNQKLRIREAELENHEHKFKEQLKERKRTEDLLRRNEESLLNRQKQLEKQMSQRLAKLDEETDKRKKWEDLLSIKEDELRKLEASSNARTKQLEESIALREQTEANLETSRAGLEKYRKELEALSKGREKEIATLVENQKKEFNTEHSARQQGESQLKKTAELLQNTQTRLKTLVENHAVELEHEVSERQIAAKQLIQSSEELGELKQKFNIRIEEETKALKHELAQKQIREKGLRQHEKDLEIRIQELEKSLHHKVREYDEKIQAHETTEMQCKQMENKMEQLTNRQKQLIERETQKLNLHIAEIRLNEIKLRKQVGDLQQEKEDLENIVEVRTAELVNATKEQKKLNTALSDTQANLEKLGKEQDSIVAKKSEGLQDELKNLKQSEDELRQQEGQLQKQSANLEETIKKLTTNLQAETQQREVVEKELKELQMAFGASQDNVSELIGQHTKELEGKIEQHKQNEIGLQKTEETLKKQIDKLQQNINTRTDELAEARKEREKAEVDLVQTIERSGQSAKEIEAKITEIKKEHLAEIKKIKDEQNELRQNEQHYRALFQTSADAFLQINPKNGKIHTANLAAANLFGEETTSTLADKTLDALSPKQQPGNTPSLDMAKARLHSTLETGHDSFEWQFQKADNSTFHGLVSFSIIEIEEKQLILAVVQDISDIKQQQAELQQTINEVHAANRINSKIVDDVNKEVQTSLEPVVNSSATIEKAENITVEQKLDMAVINRNCRALIDTMNYRCELSHIADGSDEVAPIKCDLHNLIKDLDQQYCQRAETKKLFFAVSYAQYQSANNVPKLVETDEQKVRKVLGILLGYALAHTEKGRLGLHAARKSSEGNEITVAFELAYTGVDKTDKLLSSVFGPDSTDNTDAEDMNYGLTLARRYARMLGGEIALEYRQGNVTALTIDFPFKKVASGIVMPSQDAEEKAGAA